ncbi:retinol dehydrogenase 13-like [Dysidea avara]|uniref:retinol dehydrogenase 13-like n=1 Tax=Dysidea avara TaxID=196820 RepID=UPI003327512A
MPINQYPYNFVAVGVVALGGVLILLRRYFNGGVCYSKRLLDGRTVIITGANTGIGKETAIDLAKRNAKVILACRDVERGKQAEKEIKRASKSDEVSFKQVDLASFASIKKFAAEILEEESRIDILINNAGIMRCPYWKTEDGFEMQFGVNHLGHFLLTNLLLDRIKESPASRIVVVSSRAHTRAKGINFDDINSENSYDPGVAYAQSKLANNLFTLALSKRLSGANVTVNCLHPGVIYTELGRHLKLRWLMKIILMPVVLLMVKTPWQGAQTNIYCAVAEELEGVSGRYFADCKEKEPSPAALDELAAEQLWSLSIKLTGL